MSSVAHLSTGHSRDFLRICGVPQTSQGTTSSNNAEECAENESIDTCSLTYSEAGDEAEYIIEDDIDWMVTSDEEAVEEHSLRSTDDVTMKSDTTRAHIMRFCCLPPEIGSSRVGELDVTPSSIDNPIHQECSTPISPAPMQR